MRHYFSSCILLVLVLCGTRVLAQSEPYTPKRGEPERQAILNALRVPVEKELKKKVSFKVDHLKVQQGWAFMRGVPQQPGGKAMDYKGTVYQQARKDGAFDDWICALLRKQGGKWQVVVYQIGATDVPYVEWDQAYRAPSAILKEE